MEFPHVRHSFPTFGLLTVEAPVKGSFEEGQEQQHLPSMDIVCVSDISGSMDGSKMHQLRDAVYYIADNLKEKDRLSLVTFNQEASCVLPLKRMTPEGRAMAKSAVARSFHASGGTSICQGLQEAARVLKTCQNRNTVAGVILLTDGQECQMAHSQTQETVREIASLGISLYCLGFGEDHDTDLLLKCSECAKTPFSYVALSDHLSLAFANIVEGLASIVAQDVALVLEAFPGVPLPDVLTPFEVREFGEKKTEVHIPDMFSGERRDVCLEWKNLPESLFEGSSGEPSFLMLLSASLRYRDSSKKKTLCMSQSVCVHVDLLPPSCEPEDEPDFEVSVQKTRMAITGCMQEAVKRGISGDLEGAQKLLEDQKGKVLTLLQRATSAPCQNLMEDLERALGGFQKWTQNGGEAAALQSVVQAQLLQRNVSRGLSN